MSNTRQTKKVQKKRKKRRRIFLFLVVPILVLVLGATSYGALLLHKAQSVLDESYNPIERETSKREKPVDPHNDNISILFIGVDDSDTRSLKSGSRSDALMVATFNEKAKSVKLLSIPRDSYVYIPKVGYKDKITHAHAFGGVPASIETVEEMFDIPIDYYVKMNFNAFIDVVNALDGIKVEVPYALSEMDSKDRRHAINLKPGLQELNGEEALALARTRKKDSDLERGKRQQEILKAIVMKAISVKGFTKYSDVIQAVGENMATDLSFSEMKSFFDYAAAGSGLNIETINLEGADNYINNVYYFQLDETDLEQKKQLLKTHLEVTSNVATEDDNLADSKNDKDSSS
ncbi:LCP family protein [Bacillus sp. FJAT-29790]|uniref:LCP family protein n=1 Tax=Bacillus sp. FJAT-29790 TaxID=1895002 RepID=UPI001C212C84|nr:LCP family protein [Bacillus sp. FJAT-29790]MBU8881163.1 LCP family protein [Bacillus sp. FJAT-29790]